MRNKQNRSTLGHGAVAQEQLVFGIDIEVRSGFVQYQDASVTGDCSGNGQLLPLASRRLVSTESSSEHRLIAARHGIDHLVDTQSEEHTSELQSHVNLVCRLLLEKKKTTNTK